LLAGSFQIPQVDVAVVIRAIRGAAGQQRVAGVKRKAVDPVRAGLTQGGLEVVRRGVPATPTGDTTFGESVVVKVPDGDQGCIQSSISGAYAMPPGINPTSLLVPTRFGGTPTIIDGDYAEIVPIEIGRLRASSETKGTLIYVREPADNGEFKLVTVVGWELQASELVDLTTSALAG
jgi:hypothetical protein